MSRNSARSVGRGQRAAVGLGRQVVAVTVHDQQRARCEVGRGRRGTHRLEDRRPLVERRREVRVLDDLHLSGVQQQPARVPCPVVEVGRGGERCDAADLRVACALADRQRSPGAEPGEPHPVDPEATQVRDRGVHVVEPSVEREVALGAAAPAEVHRQDAPPQLGRDAVRELGERLARLRRLAPTGREAVAQHEPGSVVQARGGLGEVAAQGQLAGAELVVHHRRAGAELVVGHGRPTGLIRRRSTPAAWRRAGSRGCAPRPRCRGRSTGTSRRP